MHKAFDQISENTLNHLFTKRNNYINFLSKPELLVSSTYLANEVPSSLIYYNSIMSNSFPTEIRYSSSLELLKYKQNIKRRKPMSITWFNTRQIHSECCILCSCSYTECNWFSFTCLFNYLFVICCFYSLSIILFMSDLRCKQLWLVSWLLISIF